MFDSSSYENPTPLAHADTSRDVFSRGDHPGLRRNVTQVIEKCLDHPGLRRTPPHQQKIPARGKKICDHPGLKRNAALATKNS
ncbi:hypothetical protein TNCV_5082781 [Trichonephila clavipes]|nr:hypothetical protein TNCV_5082781 [Trichonephila clavipes]